MHAPVASGKPTPLPPFTLQGSLLRLQVAPILCETWQVGAYEKGKMKSWTELRELGQGPKSPLSWHGGFVFLKLTRGSNVSDYAKHPPSVKKRAKHDPFTTLP